MSALRKSLAAEFIGTPLLISIGAGAATALGATHDPAVALAHGLAIMVAVAAFGDISGGHINPAVSLGLAAAGEFPVGRLAPYIIAQLLGAIAAGLSLLLLFGGPVANLGATLVNTQRIDYGGAFTFEALGTFFLVNTVLHTALRGSARWLAPFAIGMTVTMCIRCAGCSSIARSPKVVFYQRAQDWRLVGYADERLAHKIQRLDRVMRRQTVIAW